MQESVMNFKHEQAVESSNIAKAFHDGTDLYLLFNSGAVYRYENVPEHLYHSLGAAPSVGSFFHKFVKNAYRYNKVA